MLPETYCEGKVLEHLYGKINQSLQDFLLDEEKQWLIDMYKFLHGNCVLITDILDEEIIRRSTDLKAADYNPNFRKLWKNGRKTFVSIPETFKQMETDEEYFMGKSSELYFLSSKKDFCENVEKNFGLACTDLESLDQKGTKLFQFDIKSVSKSPGKGWSFLENFRYPSNAAILADNYILKDRSSWSENLYQILGNIMPDELDVEYHLTIFTREVSGLKEQYALIDNYLKEKYSYKVVLSIGLAGLGKLSLHDRDIISNYCWYRSGAGFDLFKKSERGLTSKHNTTVFIFPVTYIGNSQQDIKIEDEHGTPVQNSYFSTLDHLKKIWNELPETIGTQTLFIGERKNRLLD